MSVPTWTDADTRELINLRPTHSASQIAARLQQPRSAVSGKAKRLRAEGLLPRDVIKHFEISPMPPPRGAAARRNCAGSILRRYRRNRRPRDGSMLDLGTRQSPPPLAAWRGAPGRGAVLRRSRGARTSLLPPVSADRDPRIAHGQGNIS